MIIKKDLIVIQNEFIKAAQENDVDKIQMELI